MTTPPPVGRGLVAAALACVCASLGCASDYVARTQPARAAYEAYRPEEALQKLEQARGPEKDHLLYLLDKGMVLHAAGRYPESLEVLAQADKLSQQLDFTSVSEETAALLTSERERTYRGEDFEKLMISVLQALNFAGLGRDEDALVEVRRVDERLRKMVVDEKKPYEQLAIARYLGGVLYEDQGDLDAAFIDYQAAYKLQPSLGPLAEPLVRLARQTGREDLLRQLSGLNTAGDARPIGPAEGQVVVVIEAGRSPEKESLRHTTDAAQIIDIPHYRDRGFAAPAVVVAEGRSIAAVEVTSLSAVAKVHLDDRVGRLLAKALVQTGLKAGLAAGVASQTKSDGLGALTFLLLSQLNQADLRSWLSLPAQFQLARLRLPAGKHTLTVEAGGMRTEHPVEIRPRRVAVLVVRRY
ncbi:MAG: hypothetical protein NVSMB23_08690 [Myxococcales bacterium]